jgi:hypothetical protein
MEVIDLNVAESISQIEQHSTVPAGYAPIELSTKGKVFAPAKFHIRNFNTKDLLAIALTEEADLPERLVGLLQTMIFEKDVRVDLFHESEVIETLVRLYIHFFSSELEIDFPVEDSDKEWVLKHKEDGAELVAALESGKWKPVTTINLTTAETWDLPDTFKPYTVVGDSTFNVGFSLPHYGDILTVKRWLRETFGEKERQLAQVEQLIQYRDKLFGRYEAGENVDLSRIPTIDKEAERAYDNLQEEKALALIDVIRAVHLVYIEGKNVSELPLSERIKLVQDPRIDVKVARDIDISFENVRLGVKEDVLMHNPITLTNVIRRYSFRLVDLLQTLQLPKPN